MQEEIKKLTDMLLDIFNLPEDPSEFS